jgi:two-component system sensor histidine kinase AlgZ
MPNKNALQNCFLPDFCSLRMVFAVVILAQLFAFVLALMTITNTDGVGWKFMSMVSLFVQWCALGSCACLCYARRYLCQVATVWAALLSYLIILLVVTVLSEMAYHLVYFELSLGAKHAQFILRNVVITALITGPILRYFYVQQAWERNVKAEAQSRLQALQARIRPHFLFNSMNTIASLIRTQPAQAETAIEDLADLFRVSLRDTQPFHTLADEIELCDRYLEIEKLRLGDRLNVSYAIDSLPKDALIPPILLQPLVENAIYHGIETLAAGGTVRISGEQIKKDLHIRIENPCQAQPPTANSGHHMAQENIRERLQALYDKRATLRIEPYSDRYVIEIVLPYRNKLDEDSDR